MTDRELRYYINGYYVGSSDSKDLSDLKLASLSLDRFWAYGYEDGLGDWYTGSVMAISRNLLVAKHAPIGTVYLQIPALRERKLGMPPLSFYLIDPDPSIAYTIANQPTINARRWKKAFKFNGSRVPWAECSISNPIDK